MGRISAPHAHKLSPPTLERQIAELAGRQFGVVSKRQLREIGLGDRAIESRADRGRLVRIHTGVFAVGHPCLARNGRFLAAVLACGPAALLSHRSAAFLWNLRPDSRPAIDVTVLTRSDRRHAGIVIHRPRTFREEDRTTREGIPCTTVARTLVDLSTVLRRRALERACDQAERLQLLDVAAVRAAVGCGARRGSKSLLSILGDAELLTTTWTSSELEERFLRLCRVAGLPRPKANEWITLDDATGEMVRVDFLWPRCRLIAETDGVASHGTRQAFERDRRRDQRLALLGYTVVRFSYEQVVHRADEVVATLTRLLRQLATRAA